MALTTTPTHRVMECFRVEKTFKMKQEGDIGL